MNERSKSEVKRINALREGKRVGAANWKDLTPRKRSGPMLRIRRNGKVVR